MADSTPNFMTEEQFNRAVEDWSIITRNKMRNRAPVGLDSLPDKDKLISTQSAVRKYYGTAGKIQFTFERHGVFVHYGVGRGYVREGNQVKRGRKLSQSERLTKYRQGHTAKAVGKMKVTDRTGAVNRTPVDWFDIEIKTGIKQLADIAAEYYGDRTLCALLTQMDKALIEKK